jgi:hypothetical protein
MASILIGIGIFGDSLRTSGPQGPLEVILVLVMSVDKVIYPLDPFALKRYYRAV